MPLHVPPPTRTPHPSSLQREKLKEAQKKRLAEALRENLRKRKEQVRGRKRTDDECIKN